MRVPQVNERVKEAPAHALRAMFAGIGQLLSVTDKLRSKSAQAPATAETADKAPETAAANGAATASEAVVTTETATAKTPASKTTAKAAAPAAPAAPKSKAPTPDSAVAGGHVKLISPEKAAPKAGTSKAPTSAPTEAKVDEPTVEEAPPAAAAEPVPAEPAAVAKPAAAKPGVAEVTSAAELPLANYDSLTIQSLRARLRNLSLAQLGQLIAYEKAHAARADVIAMFERRVAKLESES